MALSYRCLLSLCVCCVADVGHFTLIDDAVTTVADKNNNFFVDVHSLGRPRAEVVTELMLEMNAEVKGEAIVKDVREILKGDLNFFNQFSIVIVCEPSLPVQDLLPLAAHLWTANIPLVLMQTKGLLGSARLQVREHAIVESHPGSDKYDLYVHPSQSALWPEMRAYFAQFKVFRSDFEGNAAGQPDGEEHAHIPYVAILHACITRWASEHDGKLPATYDEKKAFKESIRAAAWDADEGNFHEAIEYAMRAYDVPRFEKQTQLVFDDPAVHDDAVLKSSPFWMQVRAVSDFIANEGAGVNYPVSQNLPDMHCKTAYYVQLKQLYASKYAKDFAAVSAHLAKHLARLGLPADFVNQAELDRFVRNIRTLRIVRTRSLAQEYGNDGTSAPAAAAAAGAGAGAAGAEFQTDYVREILEEEDYDAEDDGDAAGSESSRKLHNPKNLHWYFGLRAADIFLAGEGRAAGAKAKGDHSAVSMDQLNADVLALQRIERDLLKATGLSEVVPEPDMAVLSEVCRSGSCEPHVTAAFLGGIASQITLKLLLRQYVPINNTMIWNGLFASANTYAM